MAGAQDGVAQLKLRLEEAEKNTVMAATYGKQLLEENHELHSKLEETIKEYSLKIEALEQDKHAVTLKYETKVQNEHSLSLELEQLREQQAKQLESQIAKLTKNFEKEIQILNKKVASADGALEREQTEKQQNSDHASLMEAQLKEAQERIDMYNTSIHDESTDENTASMQSQIMTLTCEKQELEVQVSSLKAEVKTTKLRLSQAEKNVEMLKKEVEDLECQSTSYFNALEQNKEEMMELKMEIDVLKMAETDPGKKGNSLFAEVEDQRQVMERQLQDYKSKYTILKKQCEMKTQQISKMKLQLANLLSLSSNKSDAEYLHHVEESLECARTQLDTLKKQCQNEVESKVIQPIQPECDSAEAADEQNMTIFFKKMHMESQKKVEELDQDLKTAQFDKVVLSDRILQLQRKLRQAESARDATNSKLLILQVKFEELAAKKGESLSTSCGLTGFEGNGSRNRKQVTEKIPGFDNTQNVKKEEDDKAEIENRIPLQEKQININTPSEVVLQSKDDPCPIKDNVDMTQEAQIPKVMNEEEDQENTAALCSYGLKKKTKKSVQMVETVVVQENDGEVREAQLKKDDDGKQSRPIRKVLRKMNVPVVKVPSGGQQNECNQQ